MKKSLIQIMIANIIFLLTSVLSNFILPKFLSLDTYAQIKTYSLYLGYAGFFSLGYNDGMYLKYGGKDIKNIPNNDIGSNFKNYLFLECIISLIILLIGLLLKDFLISAFAIGMLANNINGYYRTFYQAIGEFKLYGQALNYEKFLLLFINLCMVFILKTDNSYIYVSVQVIVAITIMCFLGYILNKKIRFKGFGKFDILEMIFNCRMGFVLMLGNFTSSFFVGIDRWFVKILMTSEAFALFSFAASMEQVVEVFISPVTVSMYNYFCKEQSAERIIKIKEMVLIWGFIVVSLAFPAKWILEHFLQKYYNANSVVFILFATQVFYAVIKGIYVNLYKANDLQGKYLGQMVIMTIMSIALNATLFIVKHSIIAIGLGTLITSIAWMIMCEYENPTLRFSIKTYVAMTILLFSYLICGYLLSSVMGIILYLSTVLIVVYIFMNRTFKEIIELIFVRANQFKKKAL